MVPVATARFTPVLRASEKTMLRAELCLVYDNARLPAAGCHPNLPESKSSYASVVAVARRGLSSPSERDRIGSVKGGDIRGVRRPHGGVLPGRDTRRRAKKPTPARRNLSCDRACP